MSHSTSKEIVMSKQLVRICYIDHAGKKAWHKIEPRYISWTPTDTSKEPQWLLCAVDWEESYFKLKTFALQNIHHWEPVLEKAEPCTASPVNATTIFQIATDSIKSMTVMTL